MSVERPDRGGAWDFRGHLVPEYAPRRDGDPDPGEVVWAWVPFEEDPAQGKDRPIVVIGRDTDDRSVLVALMLSSKAHDADRDWFPLGRGTWDSRGRASWARLDRPLAVTEAAVRREGAVLPRDLFLRLVEAAGRSTVRIHPDAKPVPARSRLVARLRRLFGR